ncbi:MAG: response regulator [Candidatus Cloacimonetes bacterium]|nr:response regulator [Candidatus Cloacimonadota bacterium]
MCEKAIILRNILIIEDEKLFSQLLSDALQDDGKYSIDLAENGKEAFKLMQDKEYELVMTDIHMPEMSGQEFIKALRSTNQDIGIIVLTAFPKVNYIREFNDLGIEEFLTKDDCDLMALQELVQEFFRKRDIEFLADDF